MLSFYMCGLLCLCLYRTHLLLMKMSKMPLRPRASNTATVLVSHYYSGTVLIASMGRMMRLPYGDIAIADILPCNEFWLITIAEEAESPHIDSVAPLSHRRTATRPISGRKILSSLSFSSANFSRAASYLGTMGIFFGSTGGTFFEIY